MKSPMIETADFLCDDRSLYSDLQVLRSNAGWYIGTIFTDPKNGNQEPGSRDTGYFATKEEAEIELKKIESGESQTTRIKAMKYKIKCRCGATCWVPGSFDPETNAVELDSNANYEWEGGDDAHQHEEDEIVDEEDLEDD